MLSRLSRKRFKDTLDGVPHEKYRRIVGFFEAVVPIKDKKKVNGKYVDERVANFDALSKEIHDKLELLKRGKSKDLPTWRHLDHLADHIADLIHNLHLQLGHLLPGDALEYAVVTYRDEYCSKVSKALYAAYENSETRKKVACPGPDPSGKLQSLRFDFTHLINELRRISLGDYHVEGARGSLMFVLTINYLLIVSIAVVAAVVLYVAQKLKWFGDAAAISAPLILLAYCGMAGATGAYISALQRIEALPGTWPTARNLPTLRYSHSLWTVPLTGLVFAIVLSLIFAGQIVTGPLFPEERGPHLPDTPRYTLDALNRMIDWVNVSRFLAWSFIAGFAERLMPDVIDRLGEKAKKLDGTPSNKL